MNHTGVKMIVKLIGAAAILVTAAGCSSSGHSGGTHSSVGSTPPKSSAYQPQPGADAAIIAGHIRGCSGVLAGDVGSKSPGVGSTATCTLDGHLVIIDSITGSDDIPQLTSSEIYYASGQAWVAFLADQGAAAVDTTLQMQLTNDAGGLTAQALNNTGHPVASLDAQKQIATQVAKDLGGAVEHDPPAPK